MFTRSTRSLLHVLSCSILLAALGGGARAVIYVKADAPGPTHDGTSWATAYTTIEQALRNMPGGGTVWVAAGTYTGQPVNDSHPAGDTWIPLRGGIALYGGFAGTEAQLEQRNWIANPTILDGLGKGFHIQMWSSTNGSSARLDGFTIRNGRPPSNGTLYISGGDHVVINNTFIDCHAPAKGGAIFTENGNPLITRNRFINNTAGTWGGAICAHWGASIANNLFVGNAAPEGAGIYSANDGGASYYMQIMNNTFVANGGPPTGSVLTNHSAILANNIVAFNATGVRMAGGLTSRNNDIHGNTAYDTSGAPDPATSSGDISADPLFVNAAAGDYHLSTGSPCVDTGTTEWVARTVSPTAVVPDLDGHERIQGNGVDMGSYEMTGTTTYRLSLTNPSSMSSVGVDQRFSVTFTVFRLAGGIATEYNGPVTLSIMPGTGTPGATLNGVTTVNAVNGRVTFRDVWIDKPGAGYRLEARLGAAVFDTDTFNVQAMRTYVRPDGSAAGDGFSWATAKTSIPWACEMTALGGEVWVAAGTYDAFRMSWVKVYGGFRGDETLLEQRDPRANPVVVAGPVEIWGSYGLGTRLDGITVRGGMGNRVVTYTGPYGGSGFYAGGNIFTREEVTVANCRIEGGNTDHSVSATTKPGPGGGVYAAGGKLTLVNNVIVNNTATNGSAVFFDYPNLSSGPDPSLGVPEGRLVNNTIVGNTGGAAVVVVAGGKVTMGNNIIAFNAGETTATVALPGVNDVFASPGLSGSIAADPLFSDRAAGDFRLVSGSPGIDAGDNALVAGIPKDFNGEPRIQGTRVNLGAVEGIRVIDLSQSIRCLKIAAGLLGATPQDIAQLGGAAGEPGDGITLADALASVRQALSQ